MHDASIIRCYFKCGFKRFYHFFTCFFWIFLLTGCGTRSIVSVGVDEVTGKQLFDEISGRNQNIETYSAGRINISVNEDGNIENIRGTVRMKRDSVIIISITAVAGIEAARVAMTPDSIKVIDRINRSYFAGRYDELINILPFPVDYQTLEGLILGTSGHIIDKIEFLREDKRVYHFIDSRVTVDYAHNLTDVYSDIKEVDLYNFTFDNIYLLRRIEFISGTTKIYSKITFNTYYKSEDAFLPDDLDIIFTSENRSLMVNIKMGRIEINRNISFPYNIPAGYN